MDHVTHIHSAEFVLRPLGQHHTVPEKMGVGTGGVTFQTGGAVKGNLPVESFRHTFADPVPGIFYKRRFRQFLYSGAVLRLTEIPAVKFLKKGIRKAFFLIAQLLQQIFKSCIRGFQKLLPLLFRPQDGQAGIQALQGMDEIGGRRLFACRVRSAEGKAQVLVRFCQIQIQIKSLHIHQFLGAGRKLHALICEEIPVPFREDPSGLCILGDIPLVDAHEKQSADIFQTGPLHISHKDLIHAGRDQRDLGLGHTRFQDLAELFRRSGLISQYLRHFVQKFHDDPVDLGVFLFHRLLALSFEDLLLLFQFLLDPASHNKSVQAAAVFPYGLFLSGESLRKFPRLAHETFSCLIQLHNGLFRHAPVNTDPALLPVPESADTQGDHVVFQTVRLFSCDIRHPAAKIAEHAFIGKSRRDHLQSGPQILHKRIHKDRMFFIYETGNP